jgi:hypothetical protein
MWFRAGNVEDSLKSSDEFSGALQCGEFLELLGNC